MTMKKSQSVSILHFIFLLLTLAFSQLALANNIWIIAIDPGHGGTDPGAISRHLKIYEKNVTLSIANELKSLLDKDPHFHGVLTRKGDYFISVPKRSEIARQHKANLLVSIHADSNISPRLRGASVWVLSNRRANSEMGKWLEDHEKHSQLLGGAGNVLSSHSEKYFDQTVLDLQFGHSQRVGYELGSIVLKYFSKITVLNRNIPQHASLGVLRSPDIPSILVETGFLSNPEEEKKLNSLAYRKKVAYMIYQGLSEYRRKVDKTERAHKVVSNTGNNSKIKDSGLRHKVVSGESLIALARKYKVTTTSIIQLNKLKNHNLFIDQVLKIPQGMDDNEKTNTNSTDEKTKNNKKTEKNQTQKTEKIGKIPQYHLVKKGETLYSIARDYSLSPNQLLKLNPKLKDGKVLLGQNLKLRE